jgi:hypothetical protein
MPYNKSELKMPPQTNITEKRIRMSMMPFMHINVRAGLAPTSLALSLTPVSLPKNYVAFSEAFSPNSLASQPPSTFSHLMILPLALASFPKNYIAPSELAASLFCKIFIYQHLIKVYTSTIGKSAGILQTPVI